MSRHEFGEVCQKGFCPVCSLGKSLPCDNCGAPVPSDVHAEELGFCVPCSYLYWEHAPRGVCGHFVVVCPNGLDCSPFCKLCEGSGDFCPVCSGRVGSVAVLASDLFGEGHVCNECEVN